MAEWDRQEGEPTLWFARFERFRAMGDSRTLLGCLNAEQDERGTKKHSSCLSGAWQEAVKQWRWRGRATAWDDHQRALARQEEGNELAQRRKVWIAQAQGLQNKATERLLSMDADELSPRDLLAFFTEGLRLELLSRGEAESVTEQRIVSADDPLALYRQALAVVEAENEQSIPDRSGGVCADALAEDSVLRPPEGDDPVGAKERGNNRGGGE